jgi:ankyrin repeat protein
MDALKNHSVDELAKAAWDGDEGQVSSMLAFPEGKELINVPNARGMPAQLTHTTGQTAVFCASRQGKIGTLLLLLKVPNVDPSVPVTTHGGTALHGTVFFAMYLISLAASFYGHAEAVALLLARGANAEHRNNNGATARQEVTDSF